MNKGKLQALYIISIVLLIMILSIMRYDKISEPIFTVSFIIVLLIIGVAGGYCFGKDLKLYKNLIFISYIISIGFVFIPVLGVYIEDGNYHYGFPAQWFSYYSSGHVNFELSGFLFSD